jgi:hypothetical protein
MKEQKSDYEEYLEKYCKSRGISREEAEKHLLVMTVRRNYERREDECKQMAPQE